MRAFCQTGDPLTFGTDFQYTFTLDGSNQIFQAHRFKIRMYGFVLNCVVYSVEWIVCLSATMCHTVNEH